MLQLTSYYSINKRTDTQEQGDGTINERMNRKPFITTDPLLCQEVRTAIPFPDIKMRSRASHS